MRAILALLLLTGCGPAQEILDPGRVHVSWSVSEDRTLVYCYQGTPQRVADLAARHEMDVSHIYAILRGEMWK